MPWQTDLVIELANKARSYINNLFGIELNIQVYVATDEEMMKAVLNEQKELKRDTDEIEKIKFELLFILGKYFPATNEIWVVEGRGFVLDVIIHEMLHSIQKCSPHREHIVDYIAFKITGNKEYIDDFVLKDWLEIEKSVGFKKILKRLLSNGDCEDYKNKN